MLSAGDLIWVKIPASGFVGVGRFSGPRVAAKDFQIGERPALDVLTGNYHREFVNDPVRSKYFVPATWEKTVAQTHTIQEVGMFGNQNTVCKPVTLKWLGTVDRLKDLLLVA